MHYIINESIVHYIILDPDELEVYGVDLQTGPVLTSYKFEVQTYRHACIHTRAGIRLEFQYRLSLAQNRLINQLIN